MPWVDTTTRMVGRDRELAALVNAVSADRLVTVVGVGGVGKTRLVAEALRHLTGGAWADPVVVELGAVAPGQALGAVATAVGLRGVDRTRARVVDHLAGAGSLLVLDTCEHVVTEIGELVDDLARVAPGVHVLATSRTRLGRRGERAVPLATLPLPAALHMFVDRLRLSRPGFQVTRTARQQIEDLCRRLDGLPLAVEIVAPRTSSLGPEHVDVDVVVGDLAAVVDWSCRLLDPAHQRLFARLSVFPGGFDADAVVALVTRCHRSGSVSSDESTDPATVLAQLAALVDASLVVGHDGEDGRRHQLLHLVRAVAAERLVQSGEATVVAAAHAHWVADLVEDAARAGLGPDGPDAYARLDARRADIAAALRWAHDADPQVAIRIAFALAVAPHWNIAAEVAELIMVIADRVAGSDDGGEARALVAAARVSADRGAISTARRLGRRAHRLAVTPMDRYGACLVLGIVGVYGGDPALAGEHWREILTIDGLPPAVLAEAHASLALMDCYGGAPTTARREAELALATAEACGAPPVLAFAEYVLGEVTLTEDLVRGVEILDRAEQRAHRARAAHVQQVARLARFSGLVRLGRHREAAPVIGPLLEDLRSRSVWTQLWTALRILAELLAARGRPRDAAFLLAAADAAGVAQPQQGDDVARYRDLGRSLEDELGSEVCRLIRCVAATAPRVAVVDRAVAMAGELVAGSGET